MAVLQAAFFQEESDKDIHPLVNMVNGKLETGEERMKIISILVDIPSVSRITVY